MPIYSLSSLLSLYSLDAAFFVDAIRDVYEVRWLATDISSIRS